MPKKAVKAKRKSSAKRPAARKPAVTKAGVTLQVKEWGVEAILGAAYLMMDRAYVLLSGDLKRTIKVLLRPKKAGADRAKLIADFTAELHTQKVRWAVAKQNQPIREYVAEQAVLLANGQIERPAAAPEAAADQLTDEQRSEIEKLIAEVETEISEMNAKKAQRDPKNISASWEQKQEARKEGAA